MKYLTNLDVDLRIRNNGVGEQGVARKGTRFELWRISSSDFIYHFWVGDLDFTCGLG